MRAGFRSLRTWASPATTSSSELSWLAKPSPVAESAPTVTPGTSTGVGAARGEHLLRADHALVSGAGIHHVEDLDLIRDVFVVRNGAVPVGVGVDLCIIALVRRPLA